MVASSIETTGQPGEAAMTVTKGLNSWPTKREKWYPPFFILNAVEGLILPSKGMGPASGRLSRSKMSVLSRARHEGLEAVNVKPTDRSKCPFGRFAHRKKRNGQRFVRNRN